MGVCVCVYVWLGFCCRFHIKRDLLHINFTIISAGPLALISIPNQAIGVNVSDEVILNCSVSSSSDPLYNRSIPSNCSSCPLSYNHSTLTFNATNTNSGEYVCVAENKYGNIFVVFNILVNGT